MKVISNEGNYQTTTLGCTQSLRSGRHEGWHSHHHGCGKSEWKNRRAAALFPAGTTLVGDSPAPHPSPGAHSRLAVPTYPWRAAQPQPGTPPVWTHRTGRAASSPHVSPAPAAAGRWIPSHWMPPTAGGVMGIPVSLDIQPQTRLAGFSVTFSSYPAAFGQLPRLKHQPGLEPAPATINSKTTNLSESMSYSLPVKIHISNQHLWSH